MVFTCQREEEKEENRLSEEAERTFDGSRDDKARTASDEPDVAAARPHMTYQVENESQVTFAVPAIVTAT